MDIIRKYGIRVESRSRVNLDGLGESVADAIVAGRLRRVVGLNVLVDRHVVTPVLGSLTIFRQAIR